MSTKRVTALILLTTHAAYASQQAVQSTCQQIASAISAASAVYYPSTAQDVGTILQILGTSQTPFGVKGGGHTMNPGWSSSTGVQIAMSRLSEVNYDADTETADVGAGLVWDDIYSALEPYGVNVVGGRVTGIGVAGFTLGGGYSWKTNQYGLTLDTVQAFELVLPNGTVSTITESSNPDLWFGLRGGFNNFGIVTKFTLQTFPQTQVWGGVINVIAEYANQVNAATANFAANTTDPKAAMIMSYDYTIGSLLMSVILFYDAPTPPPGIFDDFLAIPYLTKDISTRSFLSLVQSAPSNIEQGDRGVFNTVPVASFSPTILTAVQNETTFWGAQMELLDSSLLVTYAVEPFLPSILTHGADSAYPPSRTARFLPLNINYAWSLPAADARVREIAVASAATLAQAAAAEGQAVQGAAWYPNYAVAGTPLADMYGANVQRLSAVRAAYDPQGVMALAGGWKF
ncbi:FAD dependent oxidoreductase [Amylocystis lapponica]|nr:FAD dependent oxidoreductase [Amylocystis lapponica]